MIKSSNPSKYLQIFNSTDYKKILKKVYYYKKPNNNRIEYFADKKLLNLWIKKSLYISSVSWEIQPGIVVLDYIKLYWKIPFYLRDNSCYFIGKVLISNSVIILNTNTSIVKIYYKNEKNNKTYLEKNIEFIGPKIEQITMEYKDGITVITNIKWDNSKSEKQNPVLYETIKTDYMQIKL